ncbi:MAG: oligosaccharide flippase family protein [Marinicaulis sp.]|nr:oligosaccharide flippase family protein [Marinicaulis sp.]
MQDIGDIKPLGERVARGAAWIVAGRFFIRSLGLINTLILARLLAPNDFGIVAVGLTMMQLLQNISDIGVSHTVVKFRTAGREHYDTLFTLSAIRGVLVSLLLLAFAPLAGGIYDDKRAVVVFLCVAAVPIFHALINPKYYEFERQLDFTKEFLATALNKIAGVIVSVTIALMFKTYLAILLGLIAGAVVQTFLSYLLRPYLPRLSLSKFKELFGFTGWVTGVSVMSALNNKLDMLFLGKLIGTSKAGAYYLGDSIAALPSQELATPLARAIYPGLSELQGSPDGMRRAFLRGVEALSIVAMPAAFGCAFIAADLVALLLGDQWDAAVPVVRYFTPAAGILALFYATQGYALAAGQPKEIFYRLLIFFCIRMPIFVWATAVYGLYGAIFSSVAGMGLLVILYLSLYQKLSGHGFFDCLFVARRSFIGIISMALYFFVVRVHLPAIEGMHLFARVAIDIVAGISFYGAGLLAAWRLEGAPKGVESAVLDQLKRQAAKLKSA